MGCGVLEDKHLEEVPGTVIFNEDRTSQALAALGENVDISTLKRDPKNPDIILVPQPSTSNENDPLLWPKWKKYGFFFIVVYGTILCGVMGPLVSADQVRIAGIFNVSLNSFAQVLSSYFVLTLGIATIFLQVASVKIGKRPVYLLTTLLLMVSGIWASYAENLGSFTGARVIMGIGGAPLEFLVGASIDDIFYVHERGIPVALWNMALLVGMNLTPVIGGQVLRNPDLGFRWAFRIFAITVGVLLVLQILFMPETTILRKRHTKEGAKESSSSSSNDGSEKSNGAVNGEEGNNAENQSTQSEIIPKRNFVQELKPVQHYFRTKSNVLTLLIRPMIMLFTPTLLWGGILYGLAITYLVMLAVTISQIFSKPPYNFEPGSVGLTYLGPFIGTLLATLIAGPVSNFIARYLSKRNNGIYEPEFRLPMIALYCFFGVMGFVGYGWTLEVHTHWMGPVFFFGMSNFAIILGATSSVGYVIDSYRHSNDSALAALIFWKNIWSFGLTWNFADQLIHYGPKYCFAIIGVLIAFASLCTIPMYIFGKRCRSFNHRKVNFGEENEVTGVR